MTVTAHTRTSAPKQKLPAGLHWSEVWLNAAGVQVEGLPGVEVPVDSRVRIAGRLLACPAEGCAHTLWLFDGDAPDEPHFCQRHGVRLVAAPLSADDPDPVAGARSRVASWARGVYEKRRDAAVAAATARLSEAQKAAQDATRRTVADFQGHAPSALAAGAVLAGGSALVWQVGPQYAAAAGAGLVSFGVLAAYVAAYVVAKVRAGVCARAAGERLDLRGKAGRRVRAHARHAALGTLASGGWLLVAAAAGVDPTTVWGCLTILLGLVLAWAVNRTHWEALSETRRRLRELARLRAVKAAEKASAEVAGLSADVEVSDPDDPLEQGRRMAAEWRRIAALETVPIGFPIARTWIVPEETREVTAPDSDGTPVRIGWEYIIQAAPGALVARPGMPSPLVSAREWVASAMEVKASTLSLVDRPDGQVNRGLLMLTERLPLGDIVQYKGAAGIRRGSDGSLFGHIGRSLLGDDVDRVLWVPGQAGGAGRYGVTGSGKTVVTQLSLLNDLYAGIFPALWDGKRLMDFSEFIGVIPLGCTVEHRDVMLRSFRAEMERRQESLTLLEKKDRHGRLAPVEALWVPERDGPPQRWTIEEFHMNARDQVFITALTELVRLQRSTATMVEIATQGGGLADAGDSVLRDQLNQIAMQIMRMGDASARLTGYRGEYMPSELPRLPGTMLMIEAEAPSVPMRSAYVHRRDEDGSIFDHLFNPAGEQLLLPAALPAETVAVYEREGLMDLWRVGQGPGGRRRLLSDTLQGRSGAVDPAPPPEGSPSLPAADVILAVVRLDPGCARAAVDGADAWRRLVAGGRVPAPSTVSRAAKQLEADGLLSRADGRWRVTEAGAERAKAAVAALLAGGPAPTDRPTDPVAPVDTSPAAIERAVELQMETARMVAEQQ